MMLRKTRAVKIIIQRILRGARPRSHGWNLDECYLSQNLVKCMFFVRRPLPRGTTSSFGAAGGAICMSRGVGAGIVDVYEEEYAEAEASEGWVLSVSLVEDAVGVIETNIETVEFSESVGVT
ncbi:hypothetical protein DY000_02041109 [Brassica cretica]|uniref:Uncharacterized protein n=1 Tax=Brassica cretica TaxID=69181 RepID=A0ABQ7B839_BRACR|nr:hypothetical protein DY000_02041109 [Brassica cretica]